MYSYANLYIFTGIFIYTFLSYNIVQFKFANYNKFETQKSF